jgi:hypothetical protein
MRRDALELDASTEPLDPTWYAPLDDNDAAGVRALVRGESVVDWSGARFGSAADVDRLLALHRIHLDDPRDEARVRYVFSEAVSYLEEHMHLRFPADLRRPSDLRDVFLLASQREGFRRRQILACAILKLMHVIHHMEAADLKFKTALSEAALLERAEAEVMAAGPRMREAGVPLVSFYGSRKARVSVITKLIAKKDNIAATVFDKLRFRLVVEQRADILPTLRWLVRNLVPFNYAIPGQCYNTLLRPSELGVPEDEGAGPTNSFSGATFRLINFICDFPVLLADDEIERAGFPFELGRVVYVMVEFQVVDQVTAAANESGENAHHHYKERQYEQVARRLRRGAMFRKKPPA